MRQIATRAEFPALLVEEGLTGVGVEVGVQEGVHARHILEHWPGTLFAVDPWRYYPDYADLANVDQDTHDARYRITIRQLFDFSKVARAHVWRMTSAEAAMFFTPRSLDFVYLDARHDYAGVVADLAAWTMLIKPGGILAGHDYLDGALTFSGTDAAGNPIVGNCTVPTVFGVKRAVDEWAANMEWTVYVTTEEAFPTWYIKVP